MNAEEYLAQRVDDQIEWYDRKSLFNQRWAKRLRLVEFIAAALIPFFAAYVTWYGIQAVVGLLGVVVAVITATVSFCQFQEHWIEYRTTCESLKKEKYLYLTASEPYEGDEEARFHLLVQRVETLISKENTNWAQYMMRPKKETTGSQAASR